MESTTKILNGDRLQNYLLKKRAPADRMLGMLGMLGVLAALPVRGMLGMLGLPGMLGTLMLGLHISFEEPVSRCSLKN